MMKEVRCWETDDGKRFNTEKEAREYEFFSSTKPNEFIFYSANGDSLGLDTPYDQVYYIETRTEESIKALEKIADEYWEVNPKHMPNEIGKFQYNEEREQWMSAKEWIENECRNWAVQVDWDEIFRSVKV